MFWDMIDQINGTRLDNCSTWSPR